MDEQKSGAILRPIAMATVLAAVPLLVWDASPGIFWGGAHDPLAAIPLALAAAICLVQTVVRRGSLPDLVKAGILAAAFLFWAANQLWPNYPKAVVLNDIAVVLFVVDVSLAILGWPAKSAKPPEDADAPYRRA